MRVSIKNIAKAAGVSHSTVSRALTDSPLVKAETKARIQRLAQEMGYTPDAIARSLVTQQTRTVGVVVTTITDPFIAEVVQGIEDTAHENDYAVILSSSAAEPDREIAAVEMLRAKRVDSVIVTSSRVGALYLEHLERIGVPVVLVNNHNEQSGRYTFSVSVDNQHGGYLATHHLIERGHRRIGYVTGPADHSDDAERLAGYRIPETLHHEDFHDANIFIYNSHYTFSDWGESGVAHPFCTLLVTSRVIAWRLKLAKDAPELVRLRDTPISL